MAENYRNVIGGLNYDAELSTADYKKYRDITEQEIISRTLLAMGSPPFTTPKYGIVDVIDPSLIASTDVNRPLAVSTSNVNTTEVSVAAGWAVAKSGAVIKCEGVFTFPLARLQVNDINIIYLENELIAAGNRRINDFMDDLNTQEVQNPEVLKVDLLTNYNNVSLYPQYRKDNMVVLAAVTVIETGLGGLELQIDMSKNVYSFIRPWFSIVDSEHRSQIGTGIVSSTNPHGFSLNDATTTGNVNLFQGLVDTGMVVSRDTKIAKVTGAKYCVESLFKSRIKTDTLGTVTSRSKYGGVNSKYIELLSYPQTVGSCYELNFQGNAIAVDLIKGTNILVFERTELLQEDMVLEYTEVSALLPPVNTANNLLNFSQPNESELAIIGGKTYTSLPDPSLNMEGVGPFPRRYTAYAIDNGTLVAYPQVIYPTTRLDVMGLALNTVETVLQYPARIRVALSRLDTVATTSVRLVIYGVDIDGNSINEYLTISTATGYQDETVPSTNFEAFNQGVVTNNIFSAVNTIQILDRVDDGPLGILQAWAEIEPSTATGLNDALQICDIYWNGHGITKIEDRRLVSNGFFRPNTISTVHSETLLQTMIVNSALQATPSLNKASALLFSEDFESVKYLDTVRGIGLPNEGIGYIDLANNNLISIGDTITLKPSKILTATTGVANTGQFLIGATVEDTKASLVAAINDVGFDSGCVATSESGSIVKVVLKSPTGSAANNIVLSASSSNPNAFAMQGYSKAYDGYIESYLDRNVIGLYSKNVPSNSNLNPTTPNYRNKYRSVAVGVPSEVLQKNKFYLVPSNFDKNFPFSFRIRGALVTKPEVWTSWTLMTPLTGLGTNQIFEVVFPSEVYKVQVELFGKLRGFGLFAVEGSV